VSKPTVGIPNFNVSSAGDSYIWQLPYDYHRLKELFRIEESFEGNLKDYAKLSSLC
jgi:hypothetical protein